MKARIPGIRYLIFLLVPFSCTYLPEDNEWPGELNVEETRNYILLEPADNSSIGPTGFVFYPGGLVDPHAYISLAGAFALSGKGHRVLIAKMPANLAIMDINAARSATADHDDLNWVIGGHSLGGASACMEVKKRPDSYKGLVLMASYPSSSTDLSGWTAGVLSLIGSEDQVVDMNNFENTMDLLPGDTSFEFIEGGNHSGFGNYGFQKGDGEALISRELQQQLVVEAMQNFFDTHGLE